jgi:hypothetical protein
MPVKGGWFSGGGRATIRHLVPAHRDVCQWAGCAVIRQQAAAPVISFTLRTRDHASVEELRRLPSGADGDPASATIAALG